MEHIEKLGKECCVWENNEKFKKGIITAYIEESYISKGVMITKKYYRIRVKNEKGEKGKKTRVPCEVVTTERGETLATKLGIV